MHPMGGFSNPNKRDNEIIVSPPNFPALRAARDALPPGAAALLCILPVFFVELLLFGATSHTSHVMFFHVTVKHMITRS